VRQSGGLAHVVVVQQTADAADAADTADILLREPKTEQAEEFESLSAVSTASADVGEYAPAGVTATPLVLLGRLKPLNLRVDVDEHEAWRVTPGAKAVATVRGNANLRTPVSFVRFEPFVLPKKSLTGDSTERVDTRVLQVIYRVDSDALPLFVGQQMDVFIEAPDNQTVAAR